MATQSAASARGKWCAALFAWGRDEGFLFWRGFPYRYQARLAAEASGCSAAWKTKSAETRVSNE